MKNTREHVSFMKSNYFQLIQHITFNNDYQFQQNMKQNNKNTTQNPNILTLYAIFFSSPVALNCKFPDIQLQIPRLANTEYLKGQVRMNRLF